MSSDRKPELPGHTPDPANGNDRDLQIAKALADYLDLVSQQEFVDAGKFCLEHPEIEAELRPLLQSLNKMDEFAETSIGVTPVGVKESLPEKLSGHKILGVIGAGGMGRVLLAYDEGLGRRVAIKMLGVRYTDNEQLRTRFMHEARALARISHPNIVQIFSLGQPSEPPHFVMELVEGASLVDAAKPLTFAQKAELMRKVALAVEFLHEHQILHRDLKPTNILVGADLQPRLLDFGLARELDNRSARVTRPGEIMGTPDYFSPEHTTPGAQLDPRSDVFSLGTILYEVLTGSLPFHAETFSEQAHLIRQEVPLLPRRINREIPGDLQNICLKALEKRPQDRYPSAQAMAEDLERFLAGEKVHASPTAYSGLMHGKIERHLRELDGWREDRIISDPEYDSLRKSYGRLVERDDSWILNARRLSIPQVSLYLGAWILIIGAAFLFLFEFAALSRIAIVSSVTAVTAIILYGGLRLWKAGQLRVGIAYLLAFCVLLSITLVVFFDEFRFFAKVAANPDWELLAKLSDKFKQTTNAQIWWADFLSLPAFFWLRRFTRSSVFALVLSVMTAWLYVVTLLRLGLLEWFGTDPGWLYYRLLPAAFLFFAAAITLERLQFTNDSRYFYPVAVFFTFVALSGLAGSHKPYQDWLQRAFPWTRGQLEYLFILNAAIYFALQWVCEKFSSPQMRVVAKAFRFAVPGHVLTSVALLELAAIDRWHNKLGDLALKHEARLFEYLLPALAIAVVYASIWKQMKNYFVVGILYLGAALILLQTDRFEGRARLSLFLLLLGTAAMYGATRYSFLKMALARMIRSRT
ncbi:MAG TPA: protein kinase [Dongiaceae bacterium]|nr:protein kinase [Dongiaceae bacterium]